MRRGENAFVVAAIILCIGATLLMCFMFDGDVMLAAFSKEESESFFMLATGPYEDLTLARTTSDLIKSRGGAGYVLKEESYEIIYAVYKEKAQGESVLKKLEGEGAYLKRVEISAPKLKWAKDKSAVEFALGYFQGTFDKLYDLTNELNAKEATIEDASIAVSALKESLVDFKSEAYKRLEGETDERAAEIKLAIVTALALVENIELTRGEVRATSSIRYQLVQLALTKKALYDRLN